MIARMATGGDPVPEAAARPDESVDPFARVIGLELDRAYRLAGLILGNAAEAEDAVAAALERAWSRRRQLRDLAALQAWFDRILVNLCRDELRRRHRLRFVAIEHAGDPPGRDPFAVALDRDALVRSLSRLGYDERVVIVLHFWADLPLDAVAHRCGWPIGTVKSRLHRGLEVLRRDPALRPDGGTG
jgi:RNA polymerase sigma factor (sigma-70 family)